MFKKFLYYLIDAQGRSYYLQNGVVQKSNTKQPLPESPDGWQDITVGYERDLKKLGVLRSFTLPLAFVKTAARILKTIFYTTSIEEPVYLIIQALQVIVLVFDQSFTMRYKYLYKGQVDFTTFSDEYTRGKITVVDGGITKAIKANEATPYTFPLNEGGELIKHDGIIFKEVAHYVNPGLDGVTDAQYLLPISFLNSDGALGGDVMFSSAQGQNLGGGISFDFSDNLNWFFSTQNARTVNIKGALKAFFSGGSAMSFKIIGAGGVIYYQSPITTYATGVEQTFPFDITPTLPDGEKLFIWVTNPLNKPTDWRDTNIDISFDYRFKTSYILAFKPSVLLKKLTEKITGSALNVDTSFVEQYDNILITSGDGIRAIDGASVKTTLAEFTEFIRVTTGAGQGIESDKLLFQPYAHFLDTSNPIDLGAATGLKVYPADDFIYNVIKIGYTAKQTDNQNDVNGKYSFHNTLVFSSPVAKPKDMDFICPYSADAYYQETIRINLEGKTTTDDKGDNENFIFDTTASGVSFDTGGVLIDTDGTGGYFAIPGFDNMIDLFKGSFRVSFTALNDGIYSVKKVVVGIGGFTVYVNEMVHTETPTTTEFGIIFHLLNRPAFIWPTPAAIPDTGSIYNVLLSPRHLMETQRPFIDSCFFDFAGKPLVFQSTEQNADLSETLGAVTVTEKADYEIGANLLFKRIYFEFDTEVPTDLISFLEAGPNRCFSFSWYGRSLKGFLIKAGISPNNNKVQSYKLLCTPDTDLTQLINLP